MLHQFGCRRKADNCVSSANIHSLKVYIHVRLWIRQTENGKTINNFRKKEVLYKTKYINQMVLDGAVTVANFKMVYCTYFLNFNFYILSFVRF